MTIERKVFQTDGVEDFGTSVEIIKDNDDYRNVYVLRFAKEEGENREFSISLSELDFKILVKKMKQISDDD